MTDQHNTAPAVWDPTARGGAGGWVRNPQRPDAESTPAAPPTPPAPRPPAPPAPRPPAPPARAEADDEDPPLGARPYLSTAPGFGPPPPPWDASAPEAATTAIPRVPPTPAPPAAAPFPAHATPQERGPQGGPLPGPGYVYPPPPPAGPPQQFPYEQPPYGNRPDYPTAHPVEDEDDEDRPNNRRAPLLIGFALLLVLAVGGGLLYASQGGGKADQAAPAPTASATGSGNPQPVPAPAGTDAAPGAATGTPAAPTDTPSPTATTAGPNAKAQAQALDGLLTKGENAKAPIGSAVAKVNSCPSKADIESTAQVFDNGAAQRQGLLAELAKLSVTDVPGGADAVNSLKSAWQLSADIDRAYASWARAVAAQGCSGKAPATADKKHADELNPQATQAKSDFMTKWNPIASGYGLATRTQDRI
ncbi:hypothetical protein [Kitasatospora sp. SUK 42]|uniref:hypothetical protein n=1 Tax=Kitasatospora sp. SUK 42 TaxID=1588882 RepID=UPI001C318A6F|nr:hypothetical protein [Kitasatospora sp. SUK 42]MBV2153758.1 hypothetical protein [Kitasatospora sp. SUK 42]